MNEWMNGMSGTRYCDCINTYIYLCEIKLYVISGSTFLLFSGMFSSVAIFTEMTLGTSQDAIVLVFMQLM